MRTISLVTKRVAVKAREAVLFGAAVIGVSLMSFTTVERNEAPEKSGKAGDVKMETVQVVSVGHNLDQVVEALKVIDPVWVDGLPKGTAKKRYRTVTSYGLAQLPPYRNESMEGFSLDDPLVWFEVSAEDCEELIDREAYPADAYPPSGPTGSVNNPFGCPNEGLICCSRGYRQTDLVKETIGTEEYWVPTTSAPYTEVNKIF